MSCRAGFNMPIIIIAILLCSSQVINAEMTTNWQAFATAPQGQWGVSISGEYDRRWLGNDLLEVRRYLCRMGATPVSFGTLWIEAGVAAMDMTTGINKFMGIPGLAAGGGCTISKEEFNYKGITPIISARATYFQSFISRTQTVNLGTRNIDSRFVWQEAFGLIGLTKRMDKLQLYGGLALRALFQDEYREIQLGSSREEFQYVYLSGVKPGVMGVVMIPLRKRFFVWIAGEAFIHAQRVTISFGQWGML